MRMIEIPNPLGISPCQPEAPARATRPLLALRAGSLIVFVLIALSGPAPARESPEDVWRGFDPTTLPLDINVIHSWREDGIGLEKLTFTGEVAGDVKVRVFAIQGAPKNDKKLPGILHIHGGGQTANVQWVKFWAARGYVCVTFDFCGPWTDRKEFTDWGPIVRANMAKAGAGWPAGTDPRTSSWYHWTLVSRRALTLLAKHPQVDPDRLGIFGISVGGTLCWSVAGSDRRVKTAVPIYGCGYNADRRRTPELSPDAALYQQTLSPEAHAPYITCPILLLNATNDFHGLMDNGYEILGSVRGPTRVAFTPRYNHHIAPEQATDVERWMDWQLKGKEGFPKSPGVQIGLTGDGVPQARVQADEPAHVKRVDIYYALGDRIPQARFWRKVGAARHGDRWEASLPVMDTWETLRAFANVTYESGVCLSTNLRRVIPGQLGKARSTLSWTSLVDDCREGPENWVYVGA